MSNPTPTPPQNEVVLPTPRWAYWLFAVVVFAGIGGGGIEHHWPIPAVAAAFGAVGGIGLGFLVRFIADCFPSHGPIDEERNMAAGVKIAGVVLLLAAIITGVVLKSPTGALASAGVAAVIGAATIFINLKYNPM
jgi:hypothetical protein